MTATRRTPRAAAVPALNPWRTALGLVALWLPAAVVLVSHARWHDVLPADIATHWSGVGLPDSIGTTTTVYALSLGVTTGAAVLGSLAALLRRRSAVADVIVMLSGLVAAPVAGAWVISAWATVDGGSAAQARLGWRLALMVPFLLLGLLPGWLLWRRAAAPAFEPGAMPAPLDLRPGERAAWSETLGATMFLVVAVAAAGAAVVFGLVGNPVAAGALLVTALLAAAFGRIEITADARGLRLRSWFFGIAFKRIALADIATAHSAQIDPLQWGGWGYRFRPGRSALVLRTGPGLVVEQHDGRQFAVTLRDPDTPARLFAALLGATRAR